MDRTLIVIKPDAVQRHRMGRILTRFEAKGLKIVGLKMLAVSQELAERMYEVHQGKPFHQPLLKFITASPVVAGVLEGADVIPVVRGLLGATNCAEAAPGTIRGDFGMSTRYNLVHASDSPESAAREIPLFFSEDELVSYAFRDEGWIYPDA